MAPRILPIVISSLPLRLHTFFHSLSYNRRRRIRKKLRQRLDTCSKSVFLPSLDINDALFVKAVLPVLSEKDVIVLHLANNMLTDTSIISLCRSPFFSRLRVLNLSFNVGITDETMKIISETLVKEKSALKALYLCGNNITDKGLKYLSDILHLTGITVLSVYENRITDQGCSYLAASQHHLQQLYIAKNHISDTGFSHLTASLPGSSLIIFDASSNRIGDAGMKELVNVISKTSLRELSLNFNRMSDAGVRTLLEAIKSSCLTHIDMDGVIMSMATSNEFHYMRRLIRSNEFACIILLCANLHRMKTESKNHMVKRRSLIRVLPIELIRELAVMLIDTR